MRMQDVAGRISSVEFSHLLFTFCVMYEQNEEQRPEAMHPRTGYVGSSVEEVGGEAQS